MFIVFFVIFIFIFTVFENSIIAGILFLVMSNVVVFFPASKRRRLFFLLITATALAFVSVAWKQYRYQDHIPDSWIHLVRQSKAEPQWRSYLGTWVVKDKQTMGRYVFIDSKQRPYLLYTEKSYQIGQELYLQANFKPAWTGQAIYHIWENIQAIGQWIQNQSKIWTSQKTSHMRSWFFQYQFNYPKRMMMKWYYGTLYEKSSIVLKQNSFGKYSIASIKQLLQSKIIQKYGQTPQAGLILWMLIGDRSQIPKDKYDEFISSGLVHIIAVSGGNILMLVLFVSAVLFFLPFYIRNAIVLVLVVFYAFLCGMDSSVMRASIMWWMSILALFWWKEIQIWRGLTVAFILMLLINPYFLVYDVGFLLSFSAILGLIFVQSRLTKRREKVQSKNTQDKKKKNKINLMQKTMNNYFYPTLGASMGVFPILIFFMGKMNILWIIGNIFILPMIPFVMIYGLLSVYVHDVFARSWLLQIENRWVEYIYRVSHIVSRYGVYLQVQNYLLKYILLCIALWWFVLWRRQGKKVADSSSIQTVGKTDKDKYYDTKLDKLRHAKL